jgi:hypothetical protein
VDQGREVVVGGNRKVVRNMPSGAMNTVHLMYTEANGVVIYLHIGFSARADCKNKITLIKKAIVCPILRATFSGHRIIFSS